jgi:hypothetical protein
MYAVRHNTLPKWTNAPYSAELVILNRGPIKAAAIYASYRVHAIDTNYWWPYCSPSILEPLSKTYSFVIPELEVGEGRIKSILAIGPTALYEVEVSYYRQNDMVKFSDKSLFYYEDGHFCDQDSLRQKQFFPILMKNVRHSTAKEKGEPPPGKSPPPPEYNLPSFYLCVPDDNESPRPLTPADFHM